MTKKQSRFIAIGSVIGLVLTAVVSIPTSQAAISMLNVQELLSGDCGELSLDECAEIMTDEDCNGLSVSECTQKIIDRDCESLSQDKCREKLEGQDEGESLESDGNNQSNANQEVEKNDTKKNNNSPKVMSGTRKKSEEITFDQIIAKARSRRQEKENKFEKARNKMTSVVNSLKRKGIGVSIVEENLAVFDSKASEFSNSFQAYLDELERLKANSNTNSYFGEAGDKFAEIKKHIRELHMFYRLTLRRNLKSAMGESNK